MNIFYYFRKIKILNKKIIIHRIINKYKNEINERIITNKINKSEMKSDMFEEIFRMPLIMDNLYKEIKRKELLEYEKKLPVPNLREFFEMTQKKQEIEVPNLKQFFELANKPIIKKQNKKQNNNNNNVYTKSYISTTTYKNGHKIENIQQTINNNGNQQTITKQLIDGKNVTDKKQAKKLLSNKKFEYNRPLYTDIFDNIFTQRKPHHNHLLPSIEDIFFF